MQSPLESSALSALGDFLLRSGGVPIYWSGGVRYSLSLWDLEEYLEAHDSLRRVKYTQFCQSDRYPPSFEWYNQKFESAYQRILLLIGSSTLDGAVFDDLLSLEGAPSFSAASQPLTESVQLAESQSASSSCVESSSQGGSPSTEGISYVPAASHRDKDPLARGFRPMRPPSLAPSPEWVDYSSVADLLDMDEADLVRSPYIESDETKEDDWVSWHRYNARCRRADQLQSYAGLANGVSTLHNLNLRMHRAETLHFRGVITGGSHPVGFFEVYARLYEVRLCRPIELIRGVSRVKTPISGPSNIASGETVLL